MRGQPIPPRWRDLFTSVAPQQRRLGYLLGLVGFLSLVTVIVLSSPPSGDALDAQTRAVFERAQQRWEQQMEIRPLRTRVTTVERYGGDQYLFIFAAYRTTGVLCGFLYARGAAPERSGGGALAGGPDSTGDCTRAAATDPEVTQLRRQWSEAYGPPQVWGVPVKAGAP